VPVNAEPGMPGPAMAQFKYLQAAALVRDLIADGTLKPGSLAPSGAELARRTGYSVLTCRRALRVLAETGELDPGLSPSSRPRVPDPDAPAAATARALSRALAARRRAAGLTQPQLAGLLCVSISTIRQAETGRLRQSRDFWAYADLMLGAGGTLIALYDAHRDATRAPGTGQPRTHAPPHSQDAGISGQEAPTRPGAR